jgi:hypothetical protein
MDHNFQGQFRLSLDFSEFLDENLTQPTFAELIAITNNIILY